MPPTARLGNFLADARVFLHEGPWMVPCPAATLTLLILGLNLLGDGVRDAPVHRSLEIAPRFPQPPQHDEETDEITLATKQHAAGY